MTDALKDALHYQAEHTEVPPVDARDVLALGKRRRRRGRTLVAAAGTAGAMVVAVAAWLGADGVTGGNEVEDPAAASGTADSPSADPSLDLYTQIGPYATGRSLHVGDVTVTLDVRPSGLYPSKLGAVVKLDPADETASTSRLLFVGADGELRELGAAGLDTVIGTDPDTTLVAFTRPASGGVERSFEVVVVDTVDGSQVARTTLDGRPWGSWDTPVVSLAGDTVYVQTATGWRAWPFQEGDAVTELEGYAPGSEVAGGVLATGDEAPVRFVRLGDGAVLSTYDVAHEEEWIELSPDGSHGIIYDWMDMVDWLVVDTATGQARPLPPVDSSLRAVTWAPSGDLVLWSGVEELSEVRTCRPSTAACEVVEGVALDDVELISSGFTSEG